MEIPLTSSTLPLWPAVMRTLPSPRGSMAHRWLLWPFWGHTMTPAPSAMETKATSRALPLWATVSTSPVTGRVG
jgi:hypothetical protein